MRGPHDTKAESSNDTHVRDDADMQKHPSSLAVLAEIFLPLAETFQKIPSFSQNISGNQRKFRLI